MTDGAVFAMLVATKKIASVAQMPGKIDLINLLDCADFIFQGTA